MDDAASGGPGSSDFRREKRAQGYARLNIPILLAESGLTAKSLRQQHNGVFEKELFPGKLRGEGRALAEAGRAAGGSSLPTVSPSPCVCRRARSAPDAPTQRGHTGGAGGDH